MNEKKNIFLSGFNKKEILFLKKGLRKKAIFFHTKLNKLKYCNSAICKNRDSFFETLNLIKKNKIHMKWIHIPFAGLENLNLDKNIIYTTCRNIQSTQVSDHAMALLLSLTRNVNLIIKNGLNTFFDRKPIELKNKNVLIIGFGGIGKEILNRIKGFRTNNFVLSNKREKKNKNVSKFFSLKNKNKSAKKIDIVFVTIPYNERNKNFINKNFIRNLNNNSILINVSRPGIFCSKDIFEFIKRKKIYGVGMDLFSKKDIKKYKKIKLFKNLILTPHIAGLSDKYNERHLDLIKSNIKNYLVGKKLLNSLKI